MKEKREWKEEGEEEEWKEEGEEEEWKEEGVSRKRKKGQSRKFSRTKTRLLHFSRVFTPLSSIYQHRLQGYENTKDIQHFSKNK